VNESSQDDDVDPALSDMFGRSLLYTIVFVAQSVAIVLATPFITRLLTTSQYGEIATVSTVMAFVVPITGLGLYLGVQQTYADYGASSSRTIAGLAATTAAILGFVTGITVRFWGPWVGAGSFKRELVLGIALAAIGAAVATMTSLLRSEERLAAFLAVGMTQAVGSQIAGLAAIVIFGRRVDNYFYGSLAGAALALTFTIPALRPQFAFRRERRAIASALRFSLPLVPHALAIILLNLGDRIVLQRDLGSTAVARYQIAYSVGSLLLLVISILNQVWEPQILAISDKKALPDLLAGISRRLAELLTLAVIAVALIAPIALSALAPARYGLGGLLSVTLITTASCLPYAWYLSHLRTLLALRRTEPLVWIAPVAALANVGLNLLLVPRHGLVGSAWATLASYALLAGLMGTVARSRLEVAHSRVALLSLDCAAVIGLMVSAVIPQRGPVWLAVRIDTAAVCVVVAMRLLAVTKGGKTGGLRFGRPS